MKFSLAYQDRPAWPPLSWVAELQRGSSVVTVQAGRRVECLEDWFCEAAWDGDFAEGSFDLTDIVAGTGGRVRPDRVVFVSAGSTLDRLVHLRRGDRLLVSNSFAGLLSFAGVRIDPTRKDFTEFLFSIVRGRSNYCRRLELDVGVVEATYVENLIWDGERLHPAPKPRFKRDFAAYGPYERFLQRTMDAVVGNARSAQRSRPLEPLVPMSSGYDSSAIAVLASRAGATEALCIAEDRDGRSDSAARLARHLGYRLHVVGREAWRDQELPEAACLAGSGGAGEVAMTGRPELLQDRLLLTGFHGDAVWSLDEKLLSDDWRRKDGSGLCLTEPRLHAGFVHCGVCFWGLDQMREIYAVSISDDLKPWDVGGSYSRPIPRRIVESGGIPREWFGMEKRGVSDLLLRAGSSAASSSDEAFGRWVRSHAGAWLARGRVPPLPAIGRAGDYCRTALLAPNLRRAGRVFEALGWRTGASGARAMAWRLSTGLSGVRRYWVTWALEETMKTYRPD